MRLSINISNLADVNGTLYFTADENGYGNQLWSSDGTPDGTVMLTDINSGGGGLGPSDLTYVDGSLYFLANDGTDGTQLWDYGVIAGSAVMVTDFGYGDGFTSGADGTGDLTIVDGTLFFTTGDGTGGQLWASNGTAAGTVMIAEFGQGSSASIYPSGLIAVDGTLFFSAYDSTHGTELWESNGTAAGTFMVQDINPGGTGSYPLPLAALNGSLLFTANDGVHGDQQLWKSDGTAEGTVLVNAIDLATGGSYPANLVVVGGELFFTANEGNLGGVLYETNGTASGTVMVTDSAGNYLLNASCLTPNNGKLLFFAENELWSADPATGRANSFSTLVPAFTCKKAPINPMTLTGSFTSSPVNTFIRSTISGKLTELRAEPCFSIPLPSTHTGLTTSTT